MLLFFKVHFVWVWLPPPTESKTLSVVSASGAAPPASNESPLPPPPPLLVSPDEPPPPPEVEETVPLELVLSMYLEANTMPNTVICMDTAHMSMMKMTSRFAVETLFLLSKSFRMPGTVHTAFIMSMARARSSVGKTRKTNMHMPKLCAVSIRSTWKNNGEKK